MIKKLDFLPGRWHLDYRIPKSTFSEATTGSGSGVFKRVYRIDTINAFNKLLGQLAVYNGSMLNIDSLANSLRIKRTEVENYLQVLENTFIIKRVYPFYKNYKKEITKTPKIYFLDLGLRNFAMNNFSEPDKRTDTGVLFENFYYLELLKTDMYGLNKINYWRTTNQTEIDFILTTETKQEAIEVKWRQSAPPKSFATIRKYYPEIKTRVVTKQDYFYS